MQMKHMTPFRTETKMHTLPPKKTFYLTALITGQTREMVPDISKNSIIYYHCYQNEYHLLIPVYHKPTHVRCFNADLSRTHQLSPPTI